jgi:hypothetical protein
MTAPPQANGNGNGQAPPLADGTTQIDPMLVTNALLNAVQQCAAGAAAASGQDAKDYMSAALNGAQAIVILDPSLAQGGTPLEHDLALEQSRGATQENIARIQGATQVQVAHVSGEHALKQAREKAAAPTPAKRKNVTVRRDATTGRATGATVEEN